MICLNNLCKYHFEYPAFFASIFIESSTSRFSSIHLANSLISELFFIVAFIFIDACEGWLGQLQYYATLSEKGFIIRLQNATSPPPVNKEKSRNARVSLRISKHISLYNLPFRKYNIVISQNYWHPPFFVRNLFLYHPDILHKKNTI